MQLVACSDCHTQFDVSGELAKRFPCRCGATVENTPPAPVDAEIRRCGACGALTDPASERCEYCRAALRRDRRDLSLICPECYARNARDSRFCTACGVTFRPESVRALGHELPCPVCTGLMPARQIGAIGINECPGCNGVWVPENRFDDLVRRALDARRSAAAEIHATPLPRVRGANPAAQAVRYRKCPECDALMQRRNFQKASGVIVDRCAAHGTWLDADELEQIAGYLLSGRQPSPALREVARAEGSGAGVSRELQPLADAARASLGRRFSGAAASRDRSGVGSLIDVLFGLLQ